MITEYEKRMVLLEEYRTRKAEEDRERRLKRRVAKRQAQAYAEMERRQEEDGVDSL